jgi:cytochrome c biogenesis protein CcmG, thiol:disulfide interchange protein DsbE
MKNTFISFFIFSISISFGQIQNTYYKNIQFDKIYNKDQYEVFKLKLTENTQKNNISFDEIFIDEVVKNDSIIKTFVVAINSKNDELEIDENQLIKEKLIGKKISDINFETLTDNTLNFKDLEGKPTLVNIWYTQCKPCVEEIPVLNKIKTKFNDKINFVSLTFNAKNEVLHFLNNHEFSFTHLVNASAFIKEIEIVSFPINIFIDKNGIIKNVDNGIPYINDGENLKISEGQKLIYDLAYLLKN